jgi:hypothetical protein
MCDRDGSERTAPSEYQVRQIAERGIPIPRTYAGAQALLDALTAYEHAHPEWAAARRAARSAKGQATRRAPREGARKDLEVAENNDPPAAPALGSAGFVRPGKGRTG